MPKQKIYVLANYGEYLSSADKESASWTFLVLCAKKFPTYQKAYAKMKSVNKRYGFDRCYVARLREEHYNADAWSQMLQDLKYEQ